VAWRVGCCLGAGSAVRSIRPGPGCGNELNLNLILPMGLRERFKDRRNLPLLFVTLEGFTEVNENEKQWDPAREERLRVAKFDIIDKLLKPRTETLLQSQGQRTADYQLAVSEFLTLNSDLSLL
jgi:hypothetical protein